MKFLTAHINILEPLMLRSSGEFDPSSRGVYSYARSLFIPRPSTVIGSLITYFSSSLNIDLTRECFNISKLEDIITCYDKILDKYGIESIRGPYLYDWKSDIAYVPLLLNLKYPRLISLYQLHDLFTERYNDILQKIFDRKIDEKLFSKLKEIEYIIKRDSIDIQKLKKIEIVGIGLKGREEGIKTARTHYIYSAEYSAYPKDFEIRFKIIVKDGSPILEKLNEKLPLKFGGEHRIISMTIRDERDIIDDEFIQTNFEYALLITPMPIKGRGKILDCIGQYGSMGLGFSIAKKKRKPIYPTILEGSVVRNIGKGNLDMERLLKFGLYYAANLIDDLEHRVLGRIGYGTFIPIKVS